MISCTFNQLEKFLRENYSRQYFQDEYDWHDFGWNVEDKEWEFAQNNIYLPFNTTEEMISKMDFYYMSESSPFLYLFDANEDQSDLDEIDEDDIAILEDTNDISSYIGSNQEGKVSFKIGCTPWIDEAYTLVAVEN